jgi:hypothetical protein
LPTRATPVTSDSAKTNASPQATVTRRETRGNLTGGF